MPLTLLEIVSTAKFLIADSSLKWVVNIKKLSKIGHVLDMFQENSIKIIRKMNIKNHITKKEISNKKKLKKKELKAKRLKQANKFLLKNKLEIKRSQKLKKISTHINMNITIITITMNKRNRSLKNKSNRLKKLKRSPNQ